MRINGFDQVKAFYSFVFDNQVKGIKSQHISFYLFLWNQNNRCNWVEWFKVPFDIGMIGSGINSKVTYYRVIRELQEWGLIRYQPGKNEWVAPMFSLTILEVQKCTSTIPLPNAEVQKQTSTDTATHTSTDTATGKSNKQETIKEEPLTNNRLRIDVDSFSESEFSPEVSERIKDATQKIAAFFNISEIKQSNHWMKIRKFIEFQARKDNLGYLADQFTSYRKLKEKKGFKHTWMNWIGQPSDHPEPYSEGAWNEQNWPKALEDHSRSAETVSSVNYSELHKRTLALGREDTPIILQKKKPNNPL